VSGFSRTQRASREIGSPFFFSSIVLSPGLPAQDDRDGRRTGFFRNRDCYEPKKGDER
jgi:hypothetical protein